MAYQDGTFPYGAPILTTLANLAYVCNSFEFDKSSETVNIIDQNGAPSGAINFPGFTTGTAQLQFAANTTAEPTTAAANVTQGVLANVNINGANVNCFVQSVKVSKPQRGPWLADITWQARIN